MFVWEDHLQLHFSPPVELFLSSFTVSVLYCSMRRGLSVPPFPTEATTRSLFCSHFSSKSSWSLSQASVPCPRLIPLELTARFKSSWESWVQCEHGKTSFPWAAGWEGPLWNEEFAFTALETWWPHPLPLTQLTLTQGQQPDRPWSLSSSAIRLY